MSDSLSLTDTNSQYPPKLPPARNLFVGKDGLRAGWGLLLFTILMALCFKGISILGKLSHIYPANGIAPVEVPPALVLFSEFFTFLATFLVTWLMSKLEKRPNRVYGLGPRRALPNFFAGLTWGVACLSLLVLTLWKTGLLAIDSRLLFSAGAMKYGAIWLVGFFLVGLLEEYLTRGYVLFTLTRGLASLYGWLFRTRYSRALGFWTSALILCTLFGLGHGKNVGESPLGMASAGLAGLLFCFSLWRTGSLWWAIGFHTSWDWAQSFLYGVADSGMMAQHHLLATHPLGNPLMSGGTTGPEGSIYVLPTLALVGILLPFTVPRTPYGESTTTAQAGVRVL